MSDRSGPSRVRNPRVLCTARASPRGSGLSTTPARLRTIHPQETACVYSSPSRLYVTRAPGSSCVRSRPCRRRRKKRRRRRGDASICRRAVGPDPLADEQVFVQTHLLPQLTAARAAHAPSGAGEGAGPPPRCTRICPYRRRRRRDSFFFVFVSDERRRRASGGEHPGENVETVETYAPTSRAGCRDAPALELQSEDEVGSLRGSAAGAEMRAPAHAEGSVSRPGAEGSGSCEGKQPAERRRFFHVPFPI